MYVFSYFPFGFEGRIWDLIVSVPDHCLSFYFASSRTVIKTAKVFWMSISAVNVGLRESHGSPFIQRLQNGIKTDQE